MAGQSESGGGSAGGWTCGLGGQGKRSGSYLKCSRNTPQSHKQGCHCPIYALEVTAPPDTTRVFTLPLQLLEAQRASSFHPYQTRVTFRSVSVEVDRDRRTSSCDRTTVHFSGVPGMAWGTAPHPGRSCCALRAGCPGCRVHGGAGARRLPQGFARLPIPPAGREGRWLCLLVTSPSFCLSIL